jgi:mono/diheme cytochrome c family protein
MSIPLRKASVLGIILLAALALIAGTAIIARFFFFPAWGMGFMRGSFRPFEREFRSNGEQIFFTGVSRNGPAITARMQGMHEMAPARMACVSCHGENGQGGPVQMMMGAFDAPDIRYQTLSGEEHGGDQVEHPPYTEEALKQAITRGVDPSGKALDWVMPRWDMTDEQLNDLIAYLKELE